MTTTSEFISLPSSYDSVLEHAYSAYDASVLSVETTIITNTRRYLSDVLTSLNITSRLEFFDSQSASDFSSLLESNSEFLNNLLNAQLALDPVFSTYNSIAVGRLHTVPFTTSSPVTTAATANTNDTDDDGWLDLNMDYLPFVIVGAVGACLLMLLMMACQKCQSNQAEKVREQRRLSRSMSKEIELYNSSKLTPKKSPSTKKKFWTDDEDSLEVMTANNNRLIALSEQTNVGEGDSDVELIEHGGSTIRSRTFDANGVESQNTITEMGGEEIVEDDTLYPGATASEREIMNVDIDQIGSESDNRTAKDIMRANIKSPSKGSNFFDKLDDAWIDLRE